LNQEEPWLGQWLQLLGNRSVIRFGWSNKADVWADIDSVQTGILNGQFKTRFVLNYQQQQIEIQLNLIGTHNVLNALAASSAAISLGESLTSIKEGLGRLKVVKGRMQALKGVGDSIVINDCYNANPKSFEAAMACLENIPQPMWLVLGDFAELGAESTQIHQQLGVGIEKSNVQQFYAVGEQMKNAVNEFNKQSGSSSRQAVHFATKERLTERLESELSSNVVVLVKGSRSQGLESIVEKITIMEDSACC
ncbi:MAG: UDP-N-acetylmuramoyl-tripeptide--D-alanyl-D-alanine ligase, partial [Cycloclasticus sp.]|nr:UDP-N-acetylmuramoyl-tripeptide--D-alanyl-D-alanine ligase [Cycloclasticus sp.]